VVFIFSYNLPLHFITISKLLRFLLLFINHILTSLFVVLDISDLCRFNNVKC